MKTKILFASIILLQFVSLYMRGEDILSGEKDKTIYDTYIKQLEAQKDIPFGELLINSAKYFLGKPYLASTLEISDKEQLVINLREFDCTTLVENCIALSQVVKSGDFSYENFLNFLTSMRYRDGKIDGYTSRLHYTSDWIYENEKRGILKNISLELNGNKVQKEINFMTSHPDLYKHLKDNIPNLAKLKEIEKRISYRNSYEIVPTAKISEIEHNIKNGDIIVFATSIKGLDYSHIGIACWQGNKLHFIHASSRMKKVVIEERTLQSYCLNSKNCTGISVLRINQK